MSEKAIEEDASIIGTACALGDAETIPIEERNRAHAGEMIRQGDSNTPLLTSRSIVKAHAIGDPIRISVPIRKLPTELLLEIFVQCIPPLIPKDPYSSFDVCESFGHGMRPEEVRARLALVCRAWNSMIDDEPRVWTTLALDPSLPAPDIISLWIKKSKAYPLDILIDSRRMHEPKVILQMIHRELWRVRCLFVCGFPPGGLEELFPPGLSTGALMMQTLTLTRYVDELGGVLGGIHCPNLRTLTLSYFNEEVKSLIVQPLQNVSYLHVTLSNGPVTLYLLLKVLPNLVSLSWEDLAEQTDDDDEFPRIALQSLKTLRLMSYDHPAICFLACLHVPLLECLDVGSFYRGPLDGHERVLDTLCGEGTVQLRHIILRQTALKGPKLHDMLYHLRHLETLTITTQYNTPKDLLISLSPHNRDFSSVCPRLKTVELSSIWMCQTLLFGFVQRRVQSDWERPAPGLVTCLKLSNIKGLGMDLCSQFAETHSSSIRLLPSETDIF